MKIYSIPFFCLFLVACGAPPKINFPTGSNRVPINEHYEQAHDQIETINVSSETENSVKPKSVNLKESF